MTQQSGRRASWWRDNSLSLVFAALFLAAIVGQAIAGLADTNQQARTAGVQEMDLWSYVTSSRFAVNVSENWQSEYLQFSLYILLTVWLVQRGSAESKKSEDIGWQSDEEQQLGAHAGPDAPRWAALGGWRTTLYSHSLAVVMGVIFLSSWSVQAVTGHVAANEDRLQELLDPVDFGTYLLQPDLWNRTFQNWQSELLAVGSMVAFTIFLRERGSPESKPVGAPHGETTSDE